MPLFYPFALGPYFFVSFFWGCWPWRLLHRDPVQLHWEQRPWSSTPSPWDRTTDLPWLSCCRYIGDRKRWYTNDIPIFYSNLPRCTKYCLNFPSGSPVNIPIFICDIPSQNLPYLCSWVGELLQLQPHWQISHSRHLVGYPQGIPMVSAPASSRWREPRGLPRRPEWFTEKTGK